MNELLDQYVKDVIKKGYTVEKYKKVSNPCVNFALDFADKMLKEAKKSDCVYLGDLCLEVSGDWHFLSVGAAEVGFNGFIRELEKHLAIAFERELGLS